jgi:hypothetical protein
MRCITPCAQGSVSLRALGAAIEGLLRETEDVPDLSARAEPHLRELTEAWDR